MVDVGEGQAVAIRIESHNHPSAVEPHQGAATGVGGIIRDVFSMGARPIALMDSLRFGPLEPGPGTSTETAARNRYLVEGVVSGISSYGNSVGVPTVGGEIVFDSCYSPTRWSTCCASGSCPRPGWSWPGPKGKGTWPYCWGRPPGGTASAAPVSWPRPGSWKARRPSARRVQVGDPFEEKKLIEACLALLDSGLAVGVQDLGAAGLSCAASETAAKAGAGMDVDVARVPRREPAMTPVEVMTSESQERMLAIVRPDDLDEVLSLCRRWEIRASVVGRVTGTGRFRVFDGLFDASGARRRAAELLLADVPVGSLGDGPDYDRPLARPADQDDRLAADPWPKLFGRFPPGTDLGPELLALLGSPGVGDPSWVWRQYDHQLFLNTVAGPGADAAVLRLKDTAGKALALTTDGKARFCRLDPRVGGRPGGAGGGPERGLRRRPPAGPGQLPELRQPRAP